MLKLSIVLMLMSTPAWGQANIADLCGPGGVNCATTGNLIWESTQPFTITIGEQFSCRPIHKYAFVVRFGEVRLEFQDQTTALAVYRAAAVIEGSKPEMSVEIKLCPPPDAP